MTRTFKTGTHYLPFTFVLSILLSEEALIAVGEELVEILVSEFLLLLALLLLSKFELLLLLEHAVIVLLNRNKRSTITILDFI
ncbi:MAG TPA: hypothetical protein VN456_10320 [Desulfosporosinus sp.]|nr:hypothetical protein [Desulfosporosinus sp.]